MIWLEFIGPSFARLIVTSCLASRLHSITAVFLDFIDLISTLAFTAYDTALILSAHDSLGLLSQAASALRAYQIPAYLDCLHVSIDTACFFTYSHSPFSIVMWRVSIGPSLARLVFSGCICIEGSPASSLLRLLACINRYCLFFHIFALAVFACDVACLHRPITRAACVLRLHLH